MISNIRQRISDLFANSVNEATTPKSSLISKISAALNSFGGNGSPALTGNSAPDTVLHGLSGQINLSNQDISAHLQREAVRTGTVVAPPTEQTDGGSSFWLSGGYRNMPVEVTTDAQTSQSAVLNKAYEEFGRRAGLSDAGVREFVAERIGQNGEQVFKRGENPTPYTDAEFSVQTGTGQFAIYATDDDIARLKAIKTREEDAAAGNAPLLVPEAGITPAQATATWDAAQPYLDEAGKTVYGAASAYMEDQFAMTPEFYEKWGLPAPDETNQTAAGRAAGHTVSAVQAAAEMATGTIEIGGGGILDATGIGAIVGVPTQVIGGATVIHGTITGANTAQNIRQDKLLNQSNKETPNSKPAIEPPPAQSAPKGKLEIEPGRTLSPAEQRIADKLVAEGKQVKVPKEIENQAGVHNPDFEVDGVKTELKTVSNIKKTDAEALSAKLSQKIGEASSQASHVILDVTEQTGVTKEIAERAVKRAYGSQKRLVEEGKIITNKTTEVRIIGKDFDITIPYIRNF